MPDLAEKKLFYIEQLKPLLDSGYSVLTPNARLARKISAAWSQKQLDQGHNCWNTATVAPLEAWLQQKWQEAVRSGLLEPLQPASAGQLAELWQETIAEHERSTRGYNLIRPTAAAEQAGRARDTLLRWQVDVNSSPYRQGFDLDEDCATFFSWQLSFVEKLNDLGLTSATDCLVSLLTCAEKMPSNKLVLYGFDHIPPLLRACAQALGEDIQELQVGGLVCDCKAIAFPDGRTELAAVARWASKLSRENPACSIGVILPNMREDRHALEYLLRREFNCLGANYTSLPVNFSAGIPLDSAPLVSDALSMLSMARQHHTVNDVVTLMQSRFHNLCDVNTAPAVQFIRHLYDTGKETITAGDLRYRASQAKLELGRVLMELSGMRELGKPALPAQWADRFSDVLDLWGWPGANSLDSIEYQQLQLWYALLEDFAAYDAVCDAMTFEEALSLLIRCCALQVSQPQTPDSNVQVLGLLEAAGLSFDFLWICDMQASNWPAAARPNPFIPMRLQRDMQMPNATSEREWAFATGLMSQYMRCASQIIASYATQQDGVPEKPSALLADFNWEQPVEGEVLDPRWSSIRKSNPLEHLNDNQAPTVDSDEQDALRGGSGLIEDQSQCPFRAFARRRLGVIPLGDPSVALSAADRGSLLHDALYFLWGAIGDSSFLAAMSPSEVDVNVENAVTSAIEALSPVKRGGMGPAYFELEAKRLQRLLHEWLAVERQRTAFRVLAREESISLQLGQLSIALRADRIDELPDGARFIIDYKSGVSSAQDWLGERPAKPQLLLYGLATSETVAGLAFAQLRARDCRFTGAGQTDVAPGVQSDIQKLVKEKMPVKDWEDLAAQWQENLQRLASEFMSGDAEVDPLHATSCTYCGLQALCRVGEL